jgi:hypothetical protein
MKRAPAGFSAMQWMPKFALVVPVTVGIPVYFFTLLQSGNSFDL